MLLGMAPGVQMVGVVSTVVIRSFYQMLFKSRYTASLEARVRSLEDELRRTQDLREAERQAFERRIEELLARLLAKANVPPAQVAGAGQSPEDLMDMDIFKDLAENEMADNRKGDKLDAFAG